MVPQVTAPVLRQRTERRIAVRLPLRVSGRDRRGVIFAFMTRFDVAIGSELEIRIPFSNYASRRGEADFATQGQVVHVHDSQWDGEKLIGVRFTGPRFQRMFRSESAA